MPLSQVHEQKLSQEQIQLQSAMQVLSSKLTELPLEGLKERVENELAENPYIEIAHNEDEDTQQQDNQNWAQEYDAKNDYSSEDDIPDYLLRQSDQSYNDSPVNENFENSDSQSFLDQMMEQARENDIPDHDRQILEYLIGNLDANGMMTKPLFQIADELSIYHYCDTTVEEVERILNVLQTFEPAGIGARSLQECLLIQCNRKKTHGNSGNIAVLKKIIEKDWDNISHNRWETIRQKHNLSEQKTEALKQELRKLNPRPGNAMGEKVTSPEMYIIPDVCITVDDNGNIELTLNDGDVPTLTISEDTKEMMDITFVQDYVRRGNLFIGAIMQRRNTILRTMQAILKLQRKYFLSGDKRLLKPMSMEDISKITHQDLSTISRVCNNKFVETPYGTKPLRWFFTTAAKTSSENLSIRNLHQALRDIVEGEDKKKPFSDDALVDLLKQQGYDVARRTVAKYREHIGIPTSRMRRK